MLSDDLIAWMKPAVLGAVFGAVATIAVGFGWGGWVLGGTAERMAERRSASALSAALVPLCVRRSQEHPDRLERLADIAYAYERREFIVKAGWANMPGTDEPNRDLASACSEALAQASET